MGPNNNNFTPNPGQAVSQQQLKDWIRLQVLSESLKTANAYVEGNLVHHENIGKVVESILDQLEPVYDKRLNKVFNS